MQFERFLAAAILVILAFVASPVCAHADTYQIFSLGESNSRDIWGIDSTGTVVVLDTACPDGSMNLCYQTYLDGVPTSGDLADAPALAYDDGTPCTPSLPPGTSVFNAVCNNGREVYAALFNSPVVKGVFIGPDPVTDYFHDGSADKIVLDASGDFAWTDGEQEELFEAEDLTTDSQVPEPNGLLLIATGLLLAPGVLRRRFTM